MQNLSGLVKSMTTVKSLFLKTVKVDGEETAEHALLDGGATYALRQAKASEACAGGNGYGECHSLHVPLAQHPLGVGKRGAHNPAPVAGRPWIQNRLGTAEMRQGCPVMDRTAALQLLDPGWSELSSV